MVKPIFISMSKKTAYWTNLQKKAVNPNEFTAKFLFF